MSEIVGFPRCSRNAVLFPCAHWKMKLEANMQMETGISPVLKPMGHMHCSEIAKA